MRTPLALVFAATLSVACSQDDEARSRTPLPNWRVVTQDERGRAVDPLGLISLRTCQRSGQCSEIALRSSVVSAPRTSPDERIFVVRRFPQSNVVWNSTDSVEVSAESAQVTITVRGWIPVRVERDFELGDGDVVHMALVPANQARGGPDYHIRKEDGAIPAKTAAQWIDGAWVQENGSTRKRGGDIMIAPDGASIRLVPFR